MEDKKEQFKGFDPELQSWNFPMVINGWVHKLNGAEFKILWYILRHTYGWQKNSDTISYLQFQYGIKRKNGKWLDNGTGLSETAIKKSIKGLINKGFINVSRIKDEKGRWKVAKYSPKYKSIGTKPRVDHPPVEKCPLTIVSKQQSLSSNKGLDKPTGPKRKDITFKSEDYKKVIAKYEKLKGVKFQGREYEPIQQEVKTMFLSGRQAKDIVACMEWFAEMAAKGEKNYEWTANWTIKTVRFKIAEFLAGRLQRSEEIVIPEYAKQWN